MRCTLSSRSPPSLEMMLLLDPNGYMWVPSFGVMLVMLAVQEKKPTLISSVAVSFLFTFKLIHYSKTKKKS